MYPIIDIICSSPTMNTRSKKWHIIQNPINQLGNGYGALDIHPFFTLPNTMDNHKIVQVIQSDITTYNLQYLNEEDITDCRRIKKKNARVRCMKKISKIAELLKKLKRELRQVHKLSKTESGLSGIYWWHLGYWDKALGINVKKEEPSTPLLHIKVESPPTPDLQYPLWSPAIPSSCYCPLTQMVLKTGEI